PHHMAHCALDRDTPKAHDFFRKTTRNFTAFFPDHTKRYVAARPGHQVWKNTPQDHPEIIRDAPVAFGAQRAVFEMLFFVREHFLFFTEKFCPRKESAKRNHNHEHYR